MNMQWHENVDWAKHRLEGGLAMTSSVQPPNDPQEDPIVTAFREFAKESFRFNNDVAAALELAGSRLDTMEDALKGLDEKYEALRSAQASAATIPFTVTNGRPVHLYTEQKSRCPECDAEWLVEEPDWVKRDAWDKAVAQIVMCNNGHRFRYTMERLADRKRLTNRAETIGGFDDGNGMQYADPAEVIRQREPEFRRCANYVPHDPHNWPEPLMDALYHCDGRSQTRPDPEEGLVSREFSPAPKEE